MGGTRSKASRARSTRSSARCAGGGTGPWSKRRAISAASVMGASLTDTSWDATSWLLAGCYAAVATWLWLAIVVASMTARTSAFKRKVVTPALLSRAHRGAGAGGRLEGVLPSRGQRRPRARQETAARCDPRCRNARALPWLAADAGAATEFVGSAEQFGRRHELAVPTDDYRRRVEGVSAARRRCRTC